MKKMMPTYLRLVAILLIAALLSVSCSTADSPKTTDTQAAKTEAAEKEKETEAEDSADKTDAPAEDKDEPAEEVDGDKVSIFMSVGTGGLGDGGYNDNANAGAIRAAEELGLELQVYEPKSLSEIEAQFLAAAESEEYDLLLGIGMDNASGVDKASDAFPDQKFAIFQAVYDKPNVQSINQATEEGAYLVGLLLASLYKDNLLPGVPEGTHKAGMVIAMTNQEIEQQTYSLIAGGKSIDPDFELITMEIGSWSDHAKAKELAIALYERGCGAVFHYAGSAGNGVFEAAKEIGGYVVGAHGNQNTMADTVIVSCVEDMSAVIYNTIKSFSEGKYEPGSVRYGLKDHVVYLTYDDSKVEVPDSIKEAVAAAEKQIADGELVVPKSEKELADFIAGLD